VVEESCDDLLDIYCHEPRAHCRINRTGFDYSRFAAHPDSVHNVQALLAIVVEHAQNAFKDLDFSPTEHINIFRSMRMYDRYNQWLLQLAYRQRDARAQ
jgi:hypothetical protein